MSILARFKEIMAANVNALLDKAEDPEKMVDQYLRNLNRDLGKVKAETAAVMAEAKRSRRMQDECTEKMEKLEAYALKALKADNEGDARQFLERKQELAAKKKELESAYELAQENARQMRQMHDKLVSDIQKLEAKRRMLKAKWAVAKTRERMNKASGAVPGENSVSGFQRMEEKINRALDEADAMSKLNRTPDDDLDALMRKYDQQSSVDDELEKLKAKLKNEDQ